jgi:hypothetical protein
MEVIQDYNFACGSVWCETWSLTLREEHRLRVFENKVLDRREMRLQEGGENCITRDLYSSPSVIRISSRMRGAGHVVRMVEEEKKNAYSLLMEKPEGQRPLRRPRRRWVDNIRMDLGELGWDDVD